MNRKEQWVEEIMNSLDGIESAEPRADLFEKITAQLPADKVVEIIPLRRLRWVAVAACFIITLNIYVFRHEIRTEFVTTRQIDNTDLLDSYALYN